MSFEPRSLATDTQLHEGETGCSCHNHYALLYESREELFAVAVPYVKRGLEAGERVVYVVGDTSEAAVIDALTAGGIDVKAARASDQLVILPIDEMYPRKGTDVDPDDIVSQVKGVIEAARESPFDGVRIATEGTQLVDDGVDYEAIATVESAVNRLFDNDELTALCQYDRRRIPPGVARGIVHTHPLLATGGVVGENVQYRPPDEIRNRPQTDVADILDAHRETVTARRETRRRERQLAQIDDTASRFRDADDRELESIAVRTVRRTLDSPIVSLWRHDPVADEFAVVATSATSPVTDDDLAAVSDDAWRAYVANDVRYGDASELSLPGVDPKVDGLAFVPVDGHGVMLVTAPAMGEGGAADHHVSQTIATLLADSMDRAIIERRLDECETTMQRQRSTADLLKASIHHLVDATTQSAVESALCESLVDGDHVSLAWIGDVDIGEGTATPRHWAGSDRGYLEAVVAAGLPDPAWEAVRSGDLVVEDHVSDGIHAAEWRRAALERDFQSVASVPIEVDGITYGVLSTYASEQASFDDDALQSITALAQLAGHAIQAIDQTAALRTDRTTTLEFELATTSFPLVQLANRATCRLAVDEVVGKGDDSVLLVGTATHANEVADESDVGVGADAGTASLEPAEGGVTRIDFDGDAAAPGAHAGGRKGVTADDGNPETDLDPSSGRSHRTPTGLEPTSNATQGSDRGADVGDRADAEPGRHRVGSDRLQAAIDATVAIESGSAVHVSGDIYLLDLSFHDDFLTADISSQGAVLSRLTVDPRSVRFVIDAPEPGTARSVIDAIEARHPDVELLVKRSEVDSVESMVRPSTALEELLTDRQREVLATAFHAGYFESPRDASGETVASLLDISPQAFYQHMRRIQETVFDVLLGGE